MEKKVNKYWEIFLAYYVLTCLMIPYDYYSGEAEFTAAMTFESLVVSSGTVGLFGFIYNRRIFHRIFWQIYCIPLAIYLGDIFHRVVFKEYEAYLSVTIAVIVIGLILIIPFTYAVVKYAFFSNSTWSENS